MKNEFLLEQDLNYEQNVICVCVFCRPNVCPYQDVEMVVVRQPCVQAFTRLVKVWKPNCGYTQNWCVGYERR